jgi:hypothetical protein
LLQRQQLSIQVRCQPCGSARAACLHSLLILVAVFLFAVTIELFLAAALVAIAAPRIAIATLRSCNLRVLASGELLAICILAFILIGSGLLSIL